MTRRDYAEIYRRGFAAWAEGTFEGFAEEFWHPEITFSDPPDLPDASRHEGRDAVLRRFLDYTEPLGNFDVAVDEVIERGDVVVVAVRVSGRSPQAAVPYGGTVFYVARWEGDVTVDLRLFLDRASALDAAAVA